MLDEQDFNVRDFIDAFTTSERMRSSSHFSSKVYGSEPIITTASQMSNYLPEAYRAMKSIKRYQDATPRGRWLSEAELFYKQAKAMEDFEDDYPYRTAFSTYYPSYNAMSDRQLRSYFAWRADVRRGNVEEVSTSYAFVYVYELLCGIGAEDPEDGFWKLSSIWRAWQEFSPDLDHYLETWLRDYVVYHGLDASLLADLPSFKFDQSLCQLIKLSMPYDEDVRRLLVRNGRREELPAALSGQTCDGEPARRAKKKGPTIPLPPDADTESQLFDAINAVSAYRLDLSRLRKDAPDDLRHVACAVYVRMLRYYRSHRKSGLIETLFGELLTVHHTMFASAVFFEAEDHLSCDYLLDDVHGYQCRNGHWSCTRIYGTGGKSAKLGDIMRAVDRKLRLALGYKHALKPKPLPKYLEQAIDQEIVAWLTWKEAHAPRRIAIDRSQLSSIRAAAATCREALLTDEERADAVAEVAAKIPAPAAVALEAGAEVATLPAGPAPITSTAPTVETAPAPTAAETASPLAPVHAAYLCALLAGDEATRAAAVTEARISEDMLIDAINEALFDLVGDTVIEIGEAGAQIIEDYEDDIRGVLA